MGGRGGGGGTDVQTEEEQELFCFLLFLLLSEKNDHIVHRLIIIKESVRENGGAVSEKYKTEMQVIKCNLKFTPTPSSV